jgi:antitoxin CcdA
MTRRAANLTLDRELLDEARALDINVSRAAEMGIARAVRAERAARQWAEENADVVRSNNEYVEKHGLPLAKYRMF